jgi:hypothetical protein
MPRFSSSISNFEPNRAKRQNARRRLQGRVFAVILWTLGGLILIDTVVGFVFRLPADARKEASSLQNYFDYGRSIEGKLQRMVGKTSEEDAPIVKSGWLAQTCDIADTLPAAQPSFDIYGMSFTDRIAESMEKLDPRLEGHRFGGPAAPPNHSYACFIRRFDAHRFLAPIQILGVLASSVRRMETLSGLTTSFEGPMPFTYPRYTLARNGHLVGLTVSIGSADELRAALRDSEKWRGFVEELSMNDYFYSRALFRAGILDYSVTTRMIRRAWGQRIVGERTDALGAAQGFSGAPDIAPVLRAMLLDFANKSRERGVRPVVILIEDRGYGGSLPGITVPMLKANRIDFVATSTIASPSDSSNFVPDGHFTPEAFQKIARAILRLLGRNT